MADLTARIKPKKSSTAGEVPQASDLEVAELAVNTADGKLFVKHTDDSIKEISGGGGGGGISSPALGRYYNFPTKAGDSIPTTAGSWSDRTNQIGLNKTDSNGVLFNYVKMLSLKTGDKVWFNFDNAGWVQKTLTANAFYSVSNGGFYALNFGESVTSYTTVQFAIQNPTLQDGMELEYVAANTQWEHTYGGRPKSRFAVFEWDSGVTTPAPNTGIFAFWSGSSYAINQTDFRGVFHGGRLLASPASFDVKVYAGGSLVYDGTITNLTNVNSNRATFQFGSNAWVANLVDGQLVEFYADTFDGGEYYANKGDVKVHDGVDFEARPLFTYDLADVKGVASDNEILRFNGASGAYEPTTTVISDNSDFVSAKALLGSYTYNSSAGSAPSVGLTDDYSGSNWAVNIVDNLGVSHQTALYAQTATTNVDIYVDGVFKVSTTLGNWGNKNGSRCTFFIGDDTWKTGLTGGELIEFHGEPFTFSDVTTANGQVLTWNSAFSAYQPATPSMKALSDVDPVSYAKGYQLTQGNFANAGEFALNGSGLIFDSRSQNGLGNIPQPKDNGSLWFSTSEFGPFTELTIVGNIGLTGSFAYSISSFVDRSPLDAVLTGSTVIYFHTVDPAVDPSDGQVLTWVDANSQWEPATLHASDLADVDTSPIVATAAQPYNTYDATWTSITQGEWGGNGIDKTRLYIHRLDANGVEFTPLAATGNGKEIQIRFQTSGTDYGWVTYVVDVSTIGGDIKQMVMVSPSTHPEAPGNYNSVEVRTLAPAPATDGQVLTYVAASSQWEPADPAVDSNVTQAGTGASAINNLVTISQANYDALGTPDAHTVYFIV